MPIPLRRTALLLLGSLFLCPAAYGEGEDLLEHAREMREHASEMIRYWEGMRKYGGENARRKIAYWNKYKGQTEKLQEASRNYIELNKLRGTFVKEHTECLERTRAEESRLIKQLQSILGSVQRDRGALAKAREAVRKHRESVNKLSRDAREHIRGNRSLPRIKAYRDRVITFRGEGTSLKSWADYLRIRVNGTVTAIEKVLQTAEREFAGCSTRSLWRAQASYSWPSGTGWRGT